MTLKLIDFIKEHPTDWRDILSNPPYSIIIKEDNEYILFKYDQISSDFKYDEVRDARGIILDKKDYKVKKLAFRKFFNASEQYADKLDWDSVKIQNKIDGSILSIFYDKDSWKLSTSGTINAFDAKNYLERSFGDMFIEAFELNYGNFKDFTNKLDPKLCYSFELIHPHNIIVVNYPKPDIYHICTRNMDTLEELNVDIGIKKPEEYKFNSLEDVIKMSETLKDDVEGYVCVDKYFNRVKIKSPKYVIISHMKNSLSMGGILDVILKGEENEVLSYVPSYKEYFDKIKELWKNYVIKMKEDYINIIKPILNMEIQKEYALKILSSGVLDTGYAFMCRKNKWADKDNVEHYLRDIISRENLKERLKIRENKIIE
jgi:hypothetical protein